MPWMPGFTTTPHHVSSFQGCPRWRRASTTAVSPHRRGPWVLPYVSALATLWRSPWPRLSSSGGRWGWDPHGHVGKDFCYGADPMAILGRTSTMEANHYGHAGMNLHYGADPHGHAGKDLYYGSKPLWPYWGGPLLWGQIPMPILGRTSTIEADHYGHAGIDPHDELGWTPIVSSDHNGCDGLDLDELGSHGWLGPP